MDFKPVTIKNIHDVLPHITDKPEIIQLVKTDYRVLDYVYSNKDTFDNPYAKECRGIKFDTEGRCIARPYHKFHNLNENEEYAEKNIDLSKRHHDLDKLDGSMCHSIMINGEWRLMTRKGESEVALKAMAYLDKNPTIKARYHQLFHEMRDYTLIFEYVAPHNRIVIPYKNEQLILTGIRHIHSGYYTSYDIMLGIGYAYGIPVVGLYTRETVDTDADKEGRVRRFDSGAMYKEKSPIYVRKHRSKDLVNKFKDLVALIVDDDLDDVLPQLDDKTREKVLAYKDELFKSMVSVAVDIDDIVSTHSSLDQKAFAITISSHGGVTKPLLFASRKSGESFEEIKRCIKRSYGDTTKLSTLFEELELPKWAGDFFSE